MILSLPIVYSLVFMTFGNNVSIHERMFRTQEACVNVAGSMAKMLRHAYYAKWTCYEKISGKEVASGDSNDYDPITRP